MAISTAVVFAVVYVLLDLAFGDTVQWGSLAFEAVAFGIVMTGIQYYKGRKNNK